MIRPFEFAAPFDLRVLPDSYISPAFNCALETAGYHSSSSSSGGTVPEITTADYVRAAFDHLKSLELPRTTRVGFSMTLDPYPFGGIFPQISGNVVGIPAGEEANYEIRAYRGLHLDSSLDLLDAVGTPNTDGTWVVTGSLIGGYSAQLWDLTTNEFVTEAFQETGLLRAFGSVLNTDLNWEFKSRTCRVRDQAFAVIAATAIGDYETAVRWANGLATVVQNSGQSPEEVSYFGATYEDLYVRTDTLCWIAYAFSFLCERYPENLDFNIVENLAVFNVASLWIYYLIQSPVDDPRYGAVLAGKGVYPAPAYVFDGNFVLPESFVSDNAAAYFAFKKFADVFPTHWFASLSQQAADDVAKTVKRTWESVLLRSPHAVDENNVSDIRHNLEDLAWYALVARATGNVSKQLDTLAMLENYRVAGGYTRYLATYGYGGFADGEIDVPHSALTATALFASGQQSVSDSLLNELKFVWQGVGFTSNFLDDPAHLERDQSSALAAAFTILAGRPNGFLDL